MGESHGCPHRHPWKVNQLYQVGSRENARTGATHRGWNDSKHASHSAKHDRLAMHRYFRKVAKPRELLSQLARYLVVIARHRKDPLAANLLSVR
jgi:hypothetical protein